MTSLAWSERLLLCEELDRLGPDAPTLCEGWSTRDLAAHLVVRENRPDGLLGQHLPLLSDRLEAERRRLAAGPYRDLVTQIRSGPPAWHPLHLRRVDAAGNLVEYFVHHEDVRRAQPGWEQRDLPDSSQRKLWTLLRRLGRLMYRRSPAGVVLVAPGIGRHSAHLPDAHGTVVVRGAPAELVLWSYGRRDHALVEVEGAAADIEALQSARLGLA